MNQTSLLSSAEPLTPQARLSRAISRLPAAQRDVLVLFHYERLSLTEVALLLDETEDEVAAHFYLANLALGFVTTEDGVPRGELQVA